MLAGISVDIVILHINTIYIIIIFAIQLVPAHSRKQPPYSRSTYPAVSIQQYNISIIIMGNNKNTSIQYIIGDNNNDLLSDMHRKNLCKKKCLSLVFLNILYLYCSFHEWS